MSGVTIRSLVFNRQVREPTEFHDSPPCDSLARHCNRTWRHPLPLWI